MEDYFIRLIIPPTNETRGRGSTGG